MLSDASRKRDQLQGQEPLTSPEATVVLCVRDGERTLARQLAALRAQDYDDAWEVVLVDNGSTDGTHELIRGSAAGLPRCRVLVEPRVGLNFARNRAIGASRAAKVALCDADDEVSPQWLRRMVGTLDRFDVVGGALEIDRLNEPRVRHRSHNQTDELPRSLGRPYAVGANLAFRREVWEAIGGFDARFSGGCDETDFCLRASGCRLHDRIRSGRGRALPAACGPEWDRAPALRLRARRGAAAREARRSRVRRRPAPQPLAHSRLRDPRPCGRVTGDDRESRRAAAVRRARCVPRRPLRRAVRAIGAPDEAALSYLRTVCRVKTAR